MAIEKAFDSLKQSFLEKIWFWRKIIWIEISLKDQQSCVTNDGTTILS